MSSFRLIDYTKFDAIAKARAVNVLPEIGRRYYGRDYLVTARPEDYGWDLDIRDGKTNELICHGDAKVKQSWNAIGWDRAWKYIHVESRVRQVVYHHGVDPKTGKRVVLIYFNADLSAMIFVTSLHNPARYRMVPNRREKKGEWFYHYEVRATPRIINTKEDGLYAHYHDLTGESVCCHRSGE